ncbi:disease resistance protein RPM1-like [Magnolia sinica]|uniref:disease resistance protein RPM1-like n=1 Tax=Magnolia sinica TaxID=86752 RepID=UPI002659B897|nr:disease resistance protein RPM1-like [Magnolia sinica]
MAAEGVVSFLIGKLDSFLVEEAKFLKDVSTEVRWIKDELQIMKAFLRDADARANSDAVVKTWVKQVREVAYDIEDVIDEFVLRLKQEPIHHGDGVKGFLGRTMQYIEQPNKRRRLANQIQELRTRIVDISSRKANFDFKMIELASSSSNRSSDQVSHLRSTARFVEEADLVGIDNPRNELIGLLVDGGSGLRTISVVGMGGLGKTTLVGKVYDNKRVKTEFEAFAWVAVSQTFTLDDIYRSTLKQFCGVSKEGAESINKNELMEKLRGYLQEKSIFPEDYLIKPMRLIQLWISEGFVERKEGITLEKLADEYLHELINRSLIQAASYTN